MRTDKELLDFMERQNSLAMYTGKCIMRLSGTGRGWRLHETDAIDASDTVREAIDRFIDDQER